MRPDARTASSEYAAGANLGGLFVLENWLFPNILLLRLGERGIIDNQEWDYVQRMRERGIDAVASMHAHWNGFLGGDLLKDSSPPLRLVELAAAGVSVVRIPVGYWALQAPAGAPAEAYEEPGLTAEGFVTGGARYLHAVVRWLKVVGMRAVVDMHSLPGGAVMNMGYTGRYFPSAEAFAGADDWADDGDAASLPSGSSSNLRESVECLRRLATLLASYDLHESTSGVIKGFAPWNEALFADNFKASALLGPFALKLVPQLRALLPYPRYELHLNFFNQGEDWPAWLQAHSKTLGPGLVADLHIYHAFDPPFDVWQPLSAIGCPMCTAGNDGMRALLCKTCGVSANADGVIIRRYREHGVRVVIGEWSLGSCGM